MKRKLITCATCALLAFFAGILGIFSGWSKGLEDTWYHDPQLVNDQIRIIKIDEKTMEQLGDYSTWDRGVYARLVEKLCVSEDTKPAVIGFDILFNAQKDEAFDIAFSEACAMHGNVVCAFSYVFEKELLDDGNGNLLENHMAIAQIVEPYDELAAVTNQGFVNSIMDHKDGKIRSALLYHEDQDGKRTYNFSVVIAQKYMEQHGMTMGEAFDERVLNFRYSGDISQYEAVSLCDVLNGTVPAEAFDDCIVLVGAWAQGMMDAYFVPVAQGEQMYGVEIHANLIQALMEDKVLTHVSPWVDGFVAAVILAIFVFLCEGSGVGRTLGVCLPICGIKLLADEWLFEAGYTSNHLLLPILGVLLAVYYVGLHYYKARVAKQNVEKAFKKYVAPEIVKEIAKNGTYELKLGGENRDIAVLFVDIRGFTPLSESLKPEQVVGILNRYLEMTTGCIFKHGGTLDKFIGDATMAVFNAPFDTEDYIYNAVLTAWDIVQQGNAMEAEFMEKYGKSVGFGVGVNCGPAVVGNIGCDFRMDYTAIGDTVNTAARLEANAPKGTVYISEMVYEQIKDRIEVETIGEIPLKGKSQGVFVYALKGIRQ